MHKIMIFTAFIVAAPLNPTRADKMAKQLLLKHPVGLNKETAIDRLV